MDLNAFYRDDRPGEFEVEIDVTATVREVVKADSLEAARVKVLAMIDAEEIDIDGADIETADVVRCRKTPPMFCITRPGTSVVAVSHPQPGDEPRLPNEYEPNAYKPEAVS